MTRRVNDRPHVSAPSYRHESGVSPPPPPALRCRISFTGHCGRYTLKPVESTPVIHALLHHKLDEETNGPHRLEDTLTATVFGTLVWMDAWDLLSEWLDVPTPEQGAATACWFWPRLAGPVEPDVILRIGASLVVIEAKLKSKRSDRARQRNAEDADDEAEDPTDQLVRQHIGITTPMQARQRYPDDLEEAIRDCALIQLYLVNGMRLRHAEREVIQSQNRLPAGHGLRSPITWQALSAILTARSAPNFRWKHDLLDYLRMIGLDTFNGISGLHLSAKSAQAKSWRVPRQRRQNIAEIAASPQIRQLRHWRRLETAQ